MKMGNLSSVDWAYGWGIHISHCCISMNLLEYSYTMISSFRKEALYGADEPDPRACRGVAEEAGADGRISFGGEALRGGDGRGKAAGAVAGGL